MALNRVLLIALAATACEPLRGPLFGEADASVSPAWPTEASTGVPSGVTLTPRDGDLTIDADDTVVENVDIRGCVRVNANRVTIRTSRITCIGGVPAAILAIDHVGLVLTSIEVDGQGRTEEGVRCVNCTVSQANIHHVNKGVYLGTGGTLQASYIHDLRDATQPQGTPSPGSYGVQSLEGQVIRVQRNRIVPGANALAAVLAGADLGALTDVDVEGNLLDDGQATVYAGSGSTFVATSVVIRNNRLGRGGKTPKQLTSGVSWLDNVWDDTGAPVP